MISELEARTILQAQRIERDPSDARSCLQIAEALGLTVLSDAIDIEAQAQPVGTTEV